MTGIGLRSGMIAVLVSLCGLGGAVAGELNDAAKAGDVEAVRALLASGTDVDERDFTGTALHMAAIKGHTAVAEALIAGGANIEAEGELKGAHPLHMAVQYGRPDVTRLLIDKKADVNARDNEQRTPLILAAADGHIEVAKVLLAHGADLRAVDYQRDTALHRAAFYGRLEMAELLLEQGADPDARSSDGGSPLHFAVSNGHVEVIELLVAKGADINARNAAGWTALEYARRYGGPLGIEHLLRSLGAEE